MSSTPDHNHMDRVSKKTRQTFRSSCDECAASKVRCSKEHPRCARCTQRDHECVYGRSRRMGKPPGSATKAFLKASDRHASAYVLPRTKNSDHRWNLADLVFTDTAPALDLMQNGRDTIMTEATLVIPIPKHSTHSTRMGGTHLPSESPPFLSSTPPGLGMSFGEETETTETTVVACDESEPEKSDEKADGVEDDHRTETEKYETAHESCIAAACQTLSSLYKLRRSDGACDKSPSPSKPVPSSDLVFHTARSATAKASRLLSCACSSAHDPSLLSLVATIVSRIIAWYQVLYDHDIANIDAGEPASDGSSSTAPPSPSSSSSSKPENSIYTVPLTIGTLRLPRGTETKMKAQLLLCEIKPVLDACRLLNVRIHASEDTWGERVVCEELNTHLQQKLGKLRRLLMAACS